MMRQKLKQGILLALNAADDLPMPESALLSAAVRWCKPAEPTNADAKEALLDVERYGFVQGASAPLEETTWTLTTSGIHKARHLR